MRFFIKKQTLYLRQDDEGKTQCTIYWRLADGKTLKIIKEVSEDDKKGLLIKKVKAVELHPETCLEVEHIGIPISIPFENITKIE